MKICIIEEETQKVIYVEVEENDPVENIKVLLIKSIIKGLNRS